MQCFQNKKTVDYVKLLNSRKRLMSNPTSRSAKYFELIGVVNYLFLATNHKRIIIYDAPISHVEILLIKTRGVWLLLSTLLIGLYR